MALAPHYSFESDTAFNNFSPIPRRSDLTSEELFSNFISQGTPVIIEGKLANWPAHQTWTPKVLKELYKDVVVPCTINLPTSGSPGFHKRDNYIREMPLADFVDMMEAQENPVICEKCQVARFPTLRNIMTMECFLTHRICKSTLGCGWGMEAQNPTYTGTPGIT